MIDEFIKDTLSVNYMINMKIEDFTKEQLIELSEKAYTNNLLMAIKAEHSNFHQGVLVALVRRDKARQMYNAKVNGGVK